MSRDSGGAYTLPAGNPVVAGTTITVTWGNTTLSDVATELSDSLSRSGKGGMTSPLTFANGSASLPSITWANDTNTGFYYIGTDNMAMTAGGVKIVDYADGNFTFVSSDAGATVEGIFSLFRNSASPANADFIGEYRFDGNNDAAEQTIFGALSGQIDDVADGTEAGSLLIKTMEAGTLTTQLDISSALVNITPPVTTAGVLTGLTVEATGDTAAGDNAAMGYTATEGLILTGQGSSNDVTIKNDADADVMSVPTGTVNAEFAGDVNVSGFVQVVSTGTTAIVSGAVTASGSLVTVEGEGAATDDLNVINGGGTGRIIVVRGSSSAVVTVKDGSSIRLAGGVDFPLTNTNSLLTLMSFGASTWFEISRSAN